MSVARSEQNYKTAKNIYLDVKDDFYNIENADHPNEEYMIDQTLEDIKKLNRYLGRINLDVLLDKYDWDVVDTIEINVNKMKEGAYFMEKALMSMRMYDELIPVISHYIKEVDWNSIAETQEEAEKKFTRFLTSTDNYDKYKTIVNNIVKGTMKKKAFADLFKTLKSRIAKPKVEKTDYKHPIPPVMYDKKGKEQWEKTKKKAKEDARKYEKPEGTEEFDVMGESFVSYKKYNRYLNGL